MTRLEAFSASQTLLTLRVTDAVSGRGLPQARVGIEVKTGNDEFYPGPLPLSPAGDGWFVMGASPRRIAGAFRRRITTRFRVTVRCPGYEEAVQTLRVLAADFDFEDSDVAIGGATVTRMKVRGAPFEMRVALDPRPVRLAGTVLRDMDLAAPVAGARVSVDGLPGSVTTDAAGRFVILAAPLVQVATITASKGAQSAVLAHPLDYSTPTNAVTLSLKTP